MDGRTQHGSDVVRLGQVRRHGGDGVHIAPVTTSAGHQLVLRRAEESK